MFSQQTYPFFPLFSHQFFHMQICTLAAFAFAILQLVANVCVCVCECVSLHDH